MITCQLVAHCVVRDTITVPLSYRMLGASTSSDTVDLTHLAITDMES